MNDFGTIYEEHQVMVYRFLYRMCRQEALAEELTQETFYQAMRSWRRFDGKSSVSTWLCAIAKNLYYSSLRKKPALPLADMQHAQTPDIAEMLLESDRQMLALRRLHHLSEPYREVFTLRTFCDLSHGQIGELFDKSDGWARVTYYRARQMLMEAMKEEEHEQ